MAARLSFAAAAVSAVVALGLPGSRPNEYEAGQDVMLWVNKLWSPKTQLTYKYYDLPFCTPKDLKDDKENIGQVMSGDRLQSSDYKLSVGTDSKCNVLCDKTYDKTEIARFVERIDNDYTVNWFLDGLPAAVRMYEEDNPAQTHYERGFPLGFTATPPSQTTKKHYLFNHISFLISFHQEGGKSVVDPADVAKAKATGARFRIVGFEVEPYTVKHKRKDASKPWAEAGNLESCTATRPVTRDDEPQTVDEPGEVVYTYDVNWEKSAVTWADRWDIYLRSSQDDDIHWFSIINSLMIVLFLTGMIAMILMRNLYRDIARYNEETTSEESAEETGWKLVHGDVFRPPSGFFGPMFLSVFVGSGMQILGMGSLLLLLAVTGFVSIANPGSTSTAFVVLFQLSGVFSGFFSARLYKMFKGKAWKRNTTLTAFAFPGTVYSIALFINLFLSYKRSSLAVPLTTLITLFMLWFGVSVPLTFAGSYLGFKREEIRHPVRVNNIPRQIPAQPWYLHPVPSVLVGGILPFGAVFIELYFIMSAIWLAQIYYVYGFLFLVLLILVVTCAEISVVMCYFQLCSEDYNWWWRAFLTSGSSALYLFGYAIVYFVTKLEITAPISAMLYFGYMAMASWAFFLLTGSVGFVACLTFVNRIYAAIKVD